jgi:diacylglycerol kinase
VAQQYVDSWTISKLKSHQIQFTTRTSTIAISTEIVSRLSLYKSSSGHLSMIHQLCNKAKELWFLYTNNSSMATRLILSKAAITQSTAICAATSVSLQQYVLVKLSVLICLIFLPCSSAKAVCIHRKHVLMNNSELLNAEIESWTYRPYHQYWTRARDRVHNQRQVVDSMLKWSQR